MITKKFVLAFIAYLVIVFIIAVTWHLVLFKSSYSEAGMREAPIFSLGILSMLIQATIMAYLYPLLSQRESPAKEGLKFGLLMGLFMGSYGVLAQAGKYDVGSLSTFLLLESAFFILQFAIVGTVIGLIYGKRKYR